MESTLLQQPVIPSLYEQVAEVAASKLVPDISSVRKSIPDGSSYLVQLECSIDVNGQGCLIISKRGDLCFGHRSERTNKKVDVDGLIRTIIEVCDQSTIDQIILGYELLETGKLNVQGQFILDMITGTSKSEVAAPITFHRREV